MISALTGELRQVLDDRVHVQAHAIVFELLVPVADVPALQKSMGEQVTFHTIFDLEGDASRGGLSPRLIGFLRREDKRFFELFITVKGIGPKKALRALSMPVGQIAWAIEARDAKTLATLEGIGKRMAEQIVAELSGKMHDFAAQHAVSGKTSVKRVEVDEEAILVCMQLGIPRPDAERLLERTKALTPHLKTAEALSREMLRLRTARA